MLLKLAWRNLWRNKRRTIITLASVFFAVILSIMMMSLKEGVYENMIDSMVGGYSGHAQVQDTAYKEEPILDNAMLASDSLHRALENSEFIKGYSPRISSYMLAYGKTDKSKGVSVVGIDPNKEKLLTQLDQRVVEGTYLNDNDQGIMIGNGLAELMSVKLGDTIDLIGQGMYEMQVAGRFKIMAIVKFGNPELSKSLLYMTIDKAQSLFDADGMYTNVILHPKNIDETRTAVDDLKSKLGNKYAVKTWQELHPELIKMIETDRVEGYVFMFILYMVISFGIFGTTVMMLSERTREFGVLVAIGMKRVRLAIMVFLELLIISILGALLGILGALPICNYFHKNPIPLTEEMNEMTEEYGLEAILQFSMEPSIFWSQALIVCVIAVFITIYPFLKLLKMNVIDTMRS